MAIPRRTQIMTPFLLAALVPLTGFVGVDTTVEDFADASDNIEHVKHLSYEERYGNTASDGTDLEFVDLTLSGKRVSETGFHPVRDDADGDRRNGFQRTYAMAGSYDNGLQIVDVTDPADARIVTAYDCGVYQGDVQIFTRDDEAESGTFVAFTQDDARGAKTGSDCYVESREAGLREEGVEHGTFIIDVTDPYAPETVGFVPVAKGSHNQTVHPGGKYLYNSNSDLITSAPTAGIEIFDITDLQAPEPLGQLDLPVRPGLGTESHDITFSEDGSRAYSAALSQTVIINSEDPADPSIVTSFVDPAINVEHQSDPVTLTDPVLGEREFLFVEDEFAGASGAEQTCPSGGMHVYDITDETLPVKVGYWNIDDVTTTKAAGGLGRCTAHVFELHPDEALMTVAFYNLGVSVVDLSGLVGVALGGNGVGMREVAYAAFDDSDTWAVKAPSVDRDGTFQIYGNDQQRGMDIYEVTLDLPALGASPASLDAHGTGRDLWLTPAAALERLGDRAVPADYTPYCLIPPTAT